LAADGDAVFPQGDCGTGFGDAVAITNLLSGLAGFVPMDDVGDALGGQEAL